MAAFDTTRTAYGSERAVYKIVTFVADMIGAVVAWRDAVQTRKALMALTDRELDDIGLLRSDVDSVATSHFIR
jgi:uncharacterized protein YjiS (DUF1127 family)